MSSLARYLSSLAQHRVSMALTTAALYLIPPIALSVTALWLAAPMVAWSLFTSGIFMGASGALLLLAFWRYREAYLLRKLSVLSRHGDAAINAATGASSTALDTTQHQQQEDKILHFQQNLAEYQQEQARYCRELDLKNETISRLNQELDLYRHTSDKDKERGRRELQTLTEQLQQQKALLEEYQEEIASQRQELAAREQRLLESENKIRDLTFELRDQKYELQTLLKLSDMPAIDMPLTPLQDPLPSRASLFDSSSAPQQQEEWVSTPGEALLVLKRCLETARKITAPSYYTPLHAPFGHAAPTSHPLDLRRLCDTLTAERSAALFLYSSKEEQILCATPHIETLTGWSSSVWISEGPTILNGASVEWKSTLHRLSLHGEMALPLSLTCADGSHRPCHVYLGIIAAGLFRGYIIGVLFPS